MRHSPKIGCPRVLGLAVAALASGCTNVEGRWLGDCSFQHAEESYLALIDLTIDDGKGANVEGKVTFDLSDGRSFAGKQEGLRSDTYIELEGTLIDTVSTLGPYDVTLTGEIDDDFGTITGECSFSVPGGTGRLIGDLELAR